MSFSRHRAQRGATLVESLAALALFGVAAAAVGNLLTKQIRLQGSNMTRTNAISIAGRELEDLRATDYADIATRTSTKTIGGLSYALTTSVTANVPAANMKTISTTVSWTEAAGAQTYTLNAIYTAVKR